MQKGRNIRMRVAVTYENGMIFGHFGHTKQFKVYDLEGDKVVDVQLVNTMGSGHGALASFLTELGVNVLICGGIGAGAQAALADAGIELYGGVSGGADDAVIAFMGGKLSYNPNVRCSHHNHDCGDHDCGGHDCGSHTCGEDHQGCLGNH